MRKYKPYINKGRHVVGHGLFLAVAMCLCLLASCSNDEDQLPGTGDTCRATLQLKVSSFGQDEAGGVTRSVAGNSDENIVKDLWVFQFNKQTGSQMKEPVYIGESLLDGNTDDIAIDFVQNTANESSIICVVANTHDSRWATDENGVTLGDFMTYDSFLQQALPGNVSEPFLSSNMGETGGYTIPMYGETEIIVASKTYIRVPLIRMFAKVHVSVDYSYPAAHNLSLKSITCFNIPHYSRIKEITEKGEYPSSVVWDEYARDNVSEYTLYVPENIQGVVAGMTDKATADQSLFPEHALSIKVDMIHKPMSDLGDVDYSDSHVHEYTVYPGGDMINDFNIKRNYIYNVTIKLKSEPDKDTVQP